MLGQMMEMPLLVSSILRHAARHFGHTEIVSRRVEGDLHRYTYADCEKRSKQLASALQKTGIGDGDRVATIAWNGYRHVELYYGVGGLGAVFHTINPRLHPDQIAWIVNHAEDRILAFDATFLPLMERQGEGHINSTASMAGLIATSRRPPVPNSASSSLRDRIQASALAAAASPKTFAP